MYEIKQAQIARAIDILRSGPLTAAQFAVKMWPDREHTAGGASRAGHAVLRRLGELGYIERIGDLWMTRGFPQSPAFGTAVGTAVGLGVTQGDGLPVGPLLGEPDRAAELQRLHRLVQLATDPVATVTHDAALGDVAIDGRLVDDGSMCEGVSVIADGLAYVVLAGKTMNIYPMLGAMLCGVRPAEAGRALYIRWMQSGRPPTLPHEEFWITLDDGVAAALQVPEELWEECDQWMDVRVRQQREAAGLA